MSKEQFVGIYIRVSTNRQAKEGYSLEGQLEKGLAVAREQYGADVQYKVYVDGGLSGKTTFKRTDLDRMLKDIKAGVLKCVISFKVSRLARNLADSLKIAEGIHNSKVRFISLMEGEYGTPSANLKLNILACVAQYQSEELAENVQLGMTQRAKEGLWNGGQVLGYESVDKHLVINLEEAEIVKTIYAKYVDDGWGTKKISNFLNSHGVRTKTGKAFSIVSIATILANPVYKGYIRFNQIVNWEKERRKGKNPDYLVQKGVHEPIIDEVTWEKGEMLIKNRATGTPRQYSGNFPLTGMTKCPECGGYMTSLLGAKRKDGTRKRYYVCGDYHNKGRAICNPNSIPADWLEQAVFERLSTALTSTSMLRELTDRINEMIKNSDEGKSDEKSLLENQIRDLESHIKRIQHMFESGSALYTESEALTRIAEKRESIEKLRVSYDLLANVQTTDSRKINPVSPEFLRSQLNDFLQLADKLTPLQYRQLLQASIEKIEATKKHLNHVYFSFIVHMSDEERDPLDPLHNHSKSASYIPRAFCFNKNHYLFMIRFTPIDLERTINLLQQNNPHQLMRVGHSAERKARIGAG